MIAILIDVLFIAGNVWLCTMWVKEQKLVYAFIYAAFSGAFIMVLILRVVIMYAGVAASGEVALQSWKGWAGVILSSGGIV